MHHGYLYTFLATLRGSLFLLGLFFLFLLRCCIRGFFAFDNSFVFIWLDLFLHIFLNFIEFYRLLLYRTYVLNVLFVVALNGITVLWLDLNERRSEVDGENRLAVYCLTRLTVACAALVVAV